MGRQENGGAARGKGRPTRGKPLMVTRQLDNHRVAFTGCKDRRVKAKTALWICEEIALRTCEEQAERNFKSVRSTTAAKAIRTTLAN